MSSQVPIWVPIVVALLGFAGVILTQMLNARRENRRWQLEAEREELRWSREQSSRSREARAAAYAEVMGAIEALDIVLYEGRRAREDGKSLGELVTSDIREATGNTRRALGPANVHAPEAIRDLMPKAMMPRIRLSRLVLDPASEPTGMRSEWDAGQVGYRVLRAEMRRDLGLDAEDLEVVHAQYREKPAR
ncbi:hypothetical protein ACFOWZ_29465 [Lentzea rhizosphaerae]|uniref:Uncharacterized protein n=1 Tax=Lentzea rhizosphaerae TaxID=2041025 RepID=A0ABV8C0U7_9PSEU